MALRAETLARIGGFAALADLLADDHALGAAVRRLGLRVVVAPVLPAHMATRPSLRALLAHELRWARTLRLLEPAGYLGLGVTYPLRLGLPGGCGAPLLGLGGAGRGAGGAARAGRGGGPGASARPAAPAALALLPLRDLLSFAIWAAGLARCHGDVAGPALPDAPRRQHGRAAPEE